MSGILGNLPLPALSLTIGSPAAEPPSEQSSATTNNFNFGDAKATDAYLNDGVTFADLFKAFSGGEDKTAASSGDAQKALDSYLKAALADGKISAEEADQIDKLGKAVEDAAAETEKASPEDAQKALDSYAEAAMADGTISGEEAEQIAKLGEAVEQAKAEGEDDGANAQQAINSYTESALVDGEISRDEAVNIGDLAKALNSGNSDETARNDLDKVLTLNINTAHFSQPV